MKAANCFVLLTSLLSCLGSGRLRIITSSISTVLLLGLIGCMIYVGVTEKVNWKFTGGFIGKGSDSSKINPFKMVVFKLIVYLGFLRLGPKS